MRLRDVQAILENWAPKEIAWEHDNIGLQIGSGEKRIRRILVALDVTDAVIQEAKKKRADVVISHHPLIFHPMKRVDPEERVGRLVTALIKNDIALYSAHTNLDFTKHGVSFALGEQLRLQNMRILHKDHRHLRKIAVFVPHEHVEAVAAAMTRAGAGAIGDYEGCSYRTEGVGTFTPLEGSTPAIGTKGKRETVREIKLEMILPSWKLSNVVSAMLSAHPYEEVAYDVFALENISHEIGAGVIGELRRKMTLKDFLRHVKRSLKTPSLRYSGESTVPVQRVAVCGGSGSSFMKSAIRERADAYVTADISYHTFQECDNALVLVDAGHFETEQPAVRTIVKFLNNAFRQHREYVEVFASTSSKNVFQYSIS